MASNPIAIPADLIELLGDAALSLPELARAWAARLDFAL